MAFHKDEIPTGAIDGANMVYTLANTIYQINFIEVDGAVYTGAVTPAGAQITLSDAPTATIHVTYYDTAPSVIGTTTGATVQQAMDRMARYYNYSMDEVSFTLWLDWLNDLNYMVYEKLFKVDPSKYWLTQEFTKTSSTLIFDQPTNLKSYNHIDLGMHLIDNDNNTLKDTLDEISLGEQKSGFYTDTGRFIFSGQTPNDTYRFYYVPILPALDEASDKLVIDLEYLISIIDFLDAKYGKWNVDITRESNADSRFSRELDRLLNNFSPSSKYYVL